MTEVLLRLAREGTVPARRAEEAVGDLLDLRITRYPHFMLVTEIWRSRHNLSAYDAAYVILAEKLGASLLTRDSRLAAASGNAATTEVFLLCGRMPQFEIEVHLFLDVLAWSLLLDKAPQESILPPKLIHPWGQPKAKRIEPKVILKNRRQVKTHPRKLMQKCSHSSVVPIWNNQEKLIKHRAYFFI